MGSSTETIGGVVDVVKSLRRMLGSDSKIPISAGQGAGWAELKALVSVGAGSVATMYRPGYQQHRKLHSQKSFKM